MGEMSWTAEQLAAIQTRNCNLLVAAAAGAGKTAVLVERIIRMITAEPQQIAGQEFQTDEKPIDIDNLLIVTFTKAAATEMRERIAEAISKALEENLNAERMRRQLTLLNKASITTIDSFCLEVIRNNFQMLDLDPGFRIADETEAVLLKLEVLQELFEEKYEETGRGSQVFFELLESYGGNRDDRALQNMVLDLYDFIQSNPWPDKWLDEKLTLFNFPVWEDLSECEWGQILIRAAALELQRLHNMLARALQIIESDPGLMSYYPVFQEEQSQIEKLLLICQAEKTSKPKKEDCLDNILDNSLQEGEAAGPEKVPKWDVIYELLQNFRFEKLPRAGKDCDPEQRDFVKEIRDTVKKRIGYLRENVFIAPSAEARQDLEKLYPLLKGLVDLVKDFTARYKAKKSAKALVDFNDLEHYCLEILSEEDEQGERRPSKIAQSYRERFDEILVDEYQDSNEVQETIFRMISRAQLGRPNVFMVGDVKQSIYRFRQAKPELFQEKYDNYPTYSLAQPNKNLYCKILLSQNFRSRKEVIDGVNFIFRQIMSQTVGELDYTAQEALYPGAAYPESEDPAVLIGGEIELHLLQTEGNDKNNSIQLEGIAEADLQDLSADSSENEADNPPEEEMLDNIQCEARLIAQRIKQLLRPDDSGKVFCVLDRDTKNYRPVEYRDIVILLRTTRNWAEVFVEELAQEGIPAFADTGTGFFKTVEVQVILSLLQVIDNPFQDIPLLSVLRSPLVSFTTDELAELRLTAPNGLLFEALRALAQKDGGTVSQKARKFLGDLARWRETALYLSTDQLLWRIYQESGYFAAIGAMPGGKQRQANLRILFERARQFEETSFKGLFNFNYFIDKLRSGQGDLGSAKMLSEKDNVVRIMSIHKSKGLEFPVVILGGCGKKFNLQDLRKSILFHHSLGFGPDVVDYRKRTVYPSLPKLAIREKLKLETLSEEMRILYVAMTRAKEKLIITGTVKDIAKATAKWNKYGRAKEEKLPAYQTINAENYLDWIGPVVLGSGEGIAQVACKDTFFKPEGAAGWLIRYWQKTELLKGSSREEKDEKSFLEWLKSLAGKAALLQEETLKEEQLKEETDPAGAHSLEAEIVRRLSWQYPYSKLTKLPAKLTVTELKRRFQEKDEDSAYLSQGTPTLIKKPLFLEKKKGLSSAEVGTIMHFCMQRLELKPDSVNSIEEQIEQMVDKELLTEEQAKTVDIPKIKEFLTSDLGQRMFKSLAVYREVPFNIEIPCREVYPELQDERYAQETVLLQGVVDCYFEEQDGLVLVDYKTDYVPEGGEEIIMDRYRLQIAYYARALEKLTGKIVKEKYIYLFYSGKALLIN
ncbi:MAG TPA: UvrD-helicase domain-containing protein [Peptococcaceae bacterium]|nr:UvrD-helicase domain-containing protein [Peptococcaceae bacterium]